MMWFESTFDKRSCSGVERHADVPSGVGRLAVRGCSLVLRHFLSEDPKHPPQAGETHNIRGVVEVHTQPQAQIALHRHVGVVWLRRVCGKGHGRRCLCHLASSRPAVL